MNTNNSNKPGDDSKRRTAVSSSDKLYRDRTEIYALDPKQRVFGGIWDDDKSFAVPGGGIDPNETPEQAAVREFLEETGYTLKNPVLLPQRPVISEWSEAYRATKPDRAHYSGSRTVFVGGELGERMNVDKLDTWAAHRKKTYPLERAIKLMEIVNTPKGKELHKARLAVLTHLLEQRSKETKDNAPLYHGSPQKLTHLEPRPSRVLNNERAVFATPSRLMAILFSRPYKDEDIELGIVNDTAYMREARPKSFEQLLRGPSYLHTLNPRGFYSDNRLMEIERISRQERG